MRALADHVAVITGASSGIGRATAVALARAGARVVLSGRHEAPLLAAAEEVRAQGTEAHAIVGDIRDEAVVKELVQGARDEHGRLDVLVNCAGLGYPGLVTEGVTTQWREMLETNVLALAIACREAARIMGDGQGTIVNVSSLAGSEANPYFAMYAATKHAVNGFTESLRAELEGSGVRLILVEPGQTMTSFARHVPHEYLRQVAEELGIPPERVPDFRDRHAPQEFVDEVLRRAPERFLDAEAVADRIVAAIVDPAVGDRIVIRPGRPSSHER